MRHLYHIRIYNWFVYITAPSSVYFSYIKANFLLIWGHLIQCIALLFHFYPTKKTFWIFLKFMSFFSIFCSTSKTYQSNAQTTAISSKFKFISHISISWFACNSSSKEKKKMPEKNYQMYFQKSISNVLEMDEKIGTSKKTTEEKKK